MKSIFEKVYDIRSVHSIRELLDSSTELYYYNTAFMRRVDEKVEKIPYHRLHEDTMALATYLNSIGLENKKIAVIGKNSYEWCVSYLAVVCGVGVIVPMDKELKEDELAYLAKDSGISAIIYSAESKSKLNDIPSEITLLPMEHFQQYIEKGMLRQRLGDTSYSSHVINPHAMSILIYTSGTTGLAKGVMLSQVNIVFDILSTLKRIKLTENDLTLALLPLHHTYQSMAGFLAFLYRGACIAFCDNIRHLQQDMALFKPTVFIAVPLILESFLKVLHKKYERVFAGDKIYRTQKTLSGVLGKASPKLAQSIFFSVNKAFGGRMRAILCGAASLAPEIYREYESFGFTVYVGYGLTETSPVAIMHNDSYSSPHDVGFPIEGVYAKLINVNEEGVGELLLHGPNVMLGYYNKPKETARVLKNGWFHTGDLAKKNPNGSYTIAGRIKTMIVIQSGKKIFPEELEFLLEQSPYVREALVFGNKSEDGTVQVSASIYPDYDNIHEELGKSMPKRGSKEYNEKVSELITQAVKEVNHQVPHYKCIRKIVIKKTEFEKTSTRKIKRIETNYREE